LVEDCAVVFTTALEVGDVNIIYLTTSKFLNGRDDGAYFDLFDTANAFIE